jgi:MFS family permease
MAITPAPHADAMLAAPPPLRGGSFYAWYVVAALLIVSILGYVDRLILSFLIEPIKADLVLTDTQVGMITGLAFALLYVVGGIPIGWMIDRGKRVSVLSACIVVWSGATAACGLAGNFISMFVARIFVGAGEAGLSPAAVSLIGDYFARDKVQKPLSIFTVGLYVGGGIALIAGAQMIAFLTSLGDIVLPGFGPVSAWRMTFILLALPGLAIALLLILTVKDPPRTAAKAAADRGYALSFFRQHRKLLTLMIVAVVLWGFNGYSFMNWYPAMLMRSYGMTTAEVAWTYGPAFLVGGTIGSLSLGPTVSFAMRRGRSDAVFMVSATALTVLAFGSILGPLMPTKTGVIAFAFVSMLAQSLVVASVYALITVVSPSPLRGVYTGFYMAIMNITGAAFGAVLVGVLTDNIFGSAGTDLALVTVAVIFGPISAVLMFLAAREYRRAPPIA